MLEDLGVAVHGQSFATRAVNENLAAGYPSPLAGLVNIGLLHTSLGGYDEHENYAPCRLGGTLSPVATTGRSGIFTNGRSCTPIPTSSSPETFRVGTCASGARRARPSSKPSTAS